MQINNILIFIDNNFAIIKKIIKSVKIIIKNKKYFTFAYHLKFNDIQINIDLNSFVLIKKNL